MPHRIFTLDEVAEFLHLAVSDVEMLVRREEIPYERKGERLTFRRREVEAWASARLLGFNERELHAFHRKASARAHDLSAGHAIMPELVQPSYIAPALDARTRASLLRSMVDLAEATNLLYEVDALHASLVERERMGTTALAGGIALLHPRQHEPYMFGDSFIVMGRTIQPLPFGSPDGERTDIFFLVCSQDERIHLHVLARLCMICYHTPLLLQWREQTSARAMYDSLVAAEEDVIRGLPPVP